MSLEHILLGLLHEPASGYDLRTMFKRRIRHFWSAELSQIYPVLQRLERDGLLESRLVASPRGPDRKVYTRTADGQRHLLTWLEQEPKVGTERFGYLAQLYFMDELDDLTVTRAFMVTLRAHLVRWDAALRDIEREVRASYGDDLAGYSVKGIHQFASLRMGIHSIGAKVSWCDETIATIDARLNRAGARNHPEM